MENNEKTEIEQQACSSPQPIPKEPSLRIDNTAQCASFVSQRSSSIDTFESDSPTSGGGEYFQKGEDENTASLLGVTSIEENTLAEGDESVSEGSRVESNRWLCNTGGMPVSMLHPSHRSTPVKDNEYLPTGEGGMEGGSAAAGAEEVKDGHDRSLTDEGSRPSKQIFMPGDLYTPITGHETMEARSKFTVYKIHVQNTALAEQDIEPSGWFIFRRYSDFLHLNERLKHLFPGFRLSLPPKRWFRDNFDQNFLEDRMLGLQAFLTNITGHKDICNSEPVRAFFCTDEPPGPHDSLEESRALCDTLEESIYKLRQDIQDKDEELALMKEEVVLYKSQVQILSNQLKAITGTVPVLGKRNSTPTPTSQASGSSNSNRSSLTDCDNLASGAAVSDEAKSQSPEARD